MWANIELLRRLKKKTPEPDRGTRGLILEANLLAADMIRVADSLSQDEFCFRVARILYCLFQLLPSGTEWECDEPVSLSDSVRTIAEVALILRSVSDAEYMELEPDISRLLSRAICGLASSTGQGDGAAAQLSAAYDRVLLAEEEYHRRGDPFRSYGRNKERTAFIEAILERSKSGEALLSEEEKAIVYLASLLEAKELERKRTARQKTIIVPDNDCRDYILLYGEALERESMTKAILEKHGFRGRLPSDLERWLERKRESLI